MTTECDRSHGLKSRPEIFGNLTKYIRKG